MAADSPGRGLELDVHEARGGLHVLLCRTYEKLELLDLDGILEGNPRLFERSLGVQHNAREEHRIATGPVLNLFKLSRHFPLQSARKANSLPTLMAARIRSQAKIGKRLRLTARPSRWPSSSERMNACW